jgi:hypothetical protein
MPFAICILSELFSKMCKLDYIVVSGTWIPFIYSFVIESLNHLNEQLGILLCQPKSSLEPHSIDNSLDTPISRHYQEVSIMTETSRHSLSGAVTVEGLPFCRH